jgi:hypothetical protein
LPRPHGTKSSAPPAAKWRAGVEDTLGEGAGEALLGTERDNDMPLEAITFLRCWIWRGSETEHLTDRLADDLGIGADAGEPVARLANGRRRCRASQ